jgi:uncharacterized protein YebE (UPF0316 family)
MVTTDMLITAGVIFVLRVINNGIGTIRLITLARQQRLLTAILGFFEALLFAITMAGVVTDLSNGLNLLAYCLGFSAGSWVGMVLESRFITSFLIVNIMTGVRGHEIALALRDHGFGVTEVEGEGKDGVVSMLRSVTGHREVPRLMNIVREINPDAFIAIEHARTIRGGYLGMRSVRNQPQ